MHTNRYCTLVLTLLEHVLASQPLSGCYLTNTLWITKVLLPYNISADSVTCICSAVDLTGVVTGERTRHIVFGVAKIH
jgi:hypothetical protein